MGSTTRLSSYFSKRGDNTVNFVTSRKTNMRLVRLIKTEQIKYQRPHLYIFNSMYFYFSIFLQFPQISTSHTHGNIDLNLTDSEICDVIIRRGHRHTLFVVSIEEPT